MKKDTIIGALIGMAAGAALTYTLAKKVIKKHVEDSILDELDQIEADFDEQVKEYSDLHDYALEHNDTYKQTVEDFYVEKAKSKHTDVDATNDEVEKMVMKESKHSNVVDYRQYYNQDKSVAVSEDDENITEMESETEMFQDFAERMAKEKPLHFVTREEYAASPAKEYFDEIDYIYFVKGGDVCDDMWNKQSQEDIFAALGSNWRNILSKDGVIWAIDYQIGCMYHMSCNHHRTFDEVYEQACYEGKDDTIFSDVDSRIIGVEYEE